MGKRRKQAGRALVVTPLRSSRLVSGKRVKQSISASARQELRAVKLIGF
jgi:hypothetical protein